MKKSYLRLTVMMSSFLLALVSVCIPAAFAEETDIPKWVKTVKVKGDLRLRYQLDQQEDSTGKETDQSRGRMRARIGIGAEVTDGVKVAIGLASGSGDPRSTNQTFTDSSSGKGIFLDYAYAEIKLAEPLTLYGGKIIRKEVIWAPSDLLWDTDINVEGGSFVMTMGPVFLNAGGFILQENSAASDPTVYVLQPGVDVKMGNLNIKAAVAYYTFSDVKGKALKFSKNGGNTRSTPPSLNDPDKSGTPQPTIGGLLYDYDVISPAIEIAVKMGGMLPHAALFGEYVNNSDPSNDNTGFLVGLEFGAKKVEDAGQWQFAYMYRELEKDAWLDILPDSDFAGGKTGYNGHEVIVQVGLKKNVVFGLDYYYYMAERIKNNLGTKNKTEDVLQADVMMKF